MSRLSALYEAYLRKPPRQARSRIIVEAILAGATELIRQGVDEEEVSVQEVAKRAGVGIGSLYDYFRDRRSVFSALLAKMTEDNRRSFARVLAETRDASVEEAVGKIIDFCFDTVAGDKHVKRTVLKIAHTARAMPLVLASTNVAAGMLAAALRERSDVRAGDPEVAGWVMTHSMMGIALAIIWDDDDPKRGPLREELVAMYSRYLRGAPSASVA